MLFNARAEIKALKNGLMFIETGRKDCLLVEGGGHNLCSPTHGWVNRVSHINYARVNKGILLNN